MPTSKARSASFVAPPGREPGLRGGCHVRRGAHAVAGGACSLAVQRLHRQWLSCCWPRVCSGSKSKGSNALHESARNPRLSGAGICMQSGCCRCGGDLLADGTAGREFFDGVRSDEHHAECGSAGPQCLSAPVASITTRADRAGHAAGIPRVARTKDRARTVGNQSDDLGLCGYSRGLCSDGPGWTSVVAIWAESAARGSSGASCCYRWPRCFLHRWVCRC